MVKNGYIKENYEKNLSYFKSGDLTQEDYSFLIMVDTNEKTQFDYKVKNIGKIVEIIQVKDFKQESVLNHYVCDYLINTDSSLKQQNFYSQFNQMSIYKLKFLDSYCNYNEINFIKLLKKIFSDEVFLFFLNNSEILLDKNKWIKLILENIKLNLNETYCIGLKDFLEQNIEFLNQININEVSTFNINYLKPSFEKYDEIAASIIELFYTIVCAK